MWYNLVVMVFSDTTTKENGLIQMYERLLGLGDAGISGDANKLIEATMYFNMANSDIWSDIWNAYGGHHYDSSEQSDLPYADQTLTSGTDVYALPTDSISVKGIEIKDNGGILYKLNPITLEQIHEQGLAEGNFQTTDSSPQWYSLIGRTVKLYPGPNYTQSEGFRVLYDREQVKFADSGSDTRTPGFDTPFHPLVAVGAAAIYADIKSLQRTARIEKRWQQGRADVKKFYSKRYTEMFPPRIKVADGVRQAR